MGSEFELLDLHRDGEEVVVAFRWQQNPRPFRMRVDVSGFPEGPSTGIECSIPDEWANDLCILLTEELATGYTRRAERRRVGDHIELHGHGSSGDSRYYVSDVRSVSDGSWLAQVGLDKAPASAFRRSGHLIAWLQAAKNNRRGEPSVGQSLIGWTDRARATAELLLVQTRPGTPTTVSLDLVWAAAHQAAEAGATHVTTSLHAPYLTAVGFRPWRKDGFWLSTEFVD
jgi:hypothetical protein